MIQVLADRFNKRIAFTLFFLFYAQLLCSAAAENSLPAYNSYTGNHYASTSLKNIIPAMPIAEGGYSNNATASTITPAKNENQIQLNASVLPSNAITKTDGPGPGQPEMSSFQSVNANDMVDKFSGDFSYNIPLMDVGGYPINIAYRSGISMDQEASWVGLGWNINPGTITRNLRGIPDDFDGEDTVTKTQSIRENKTIGGTIGADLEVVGTD